MRVLVCLLGVFFIFISPVHAKRIALIIGNDDYANVTKLQKAVNDAKAIATTVRDIGFKVIEQTNVNRRNFDELLNKLNSQIEVGDEVLFFFAGHGISVKGQNFLLPTDIPKITPGRERSVIKEAFSENEIISLLQERGARVSLLIIDACRNNPFPKDGTRSVGRSVGLGQRTTPPRNTFVLYSAGIGQEALDRLSDDDNNPNSVFTRKLIPLLKTPGLSHVRMAKKLQIEVEQLALTTKSRHEQFPAFYDQVRGDYYLLPDDAGSQVKIKAQTGADEILWRTIEQSKKASDFEFYLTKFPKGRYAAVAELKINQLKETKVAIGIFPDKKIITRSYKPGESFKDCTECPEMIVVPPGSFMMGSPKGEKKRGKDEGPRHKVTIVKKFAVGKFTVTRDQFELFVNDTGHKVGNKCFTYEGSKWKERSGHSFKKSGFRQDGNHPVVCVNWDDAKAFVRWLNKKVQGAPYKLLSEAEWEYVARAKTNTPFWWGKSISTSQANYDGNYTYNGSKGKYRKRTVRVDSFEPNDFGLFNVHGNVWEWVEDCWHKNYRGSPKDGKAWTRGGECSKRVLRGGSWFVSPESLRSANRFRDFSVNRIDNSGFRVSRTLAR